MYSQNVVENFCRMKVGRLMETRIGAGFFTEADVDAQIGRVRATMSSIPTYINVVIAADWRNVPVMPENVAARALKLLTTTSDRIERSGILALPDSPTAIMQLFRLVRESQHPSRKVVTSADELESWLTPVLNAAETRRLREFLSEA
jgi:hypothetical protein